MRIGRGASRRVSRLLIGALVVSSVVACRPDDQRTDSVDPAAGAQDRASWPAAMVAQLDSGNAAIRADDFRVARDHFLRVTEGMPEVAAGWFGLYLAEQGLGNAEESEAALERVRSLAAGASLIHAQPDSGS